MEILIALAIGFILFQLFDNRKGYTPEELKALLAKNEPVYENPHKYDVYGPM